MDIWSDILNRNPLYGLTVRLAKPWTPEIFIESYCVARKKQITREKTKPQTATVFIVCVFYFCSPVLAPVCSKVGERKLIALSTGWWFIQWIALSTFWTTGTWTLLCWSQLTLLKFFTCSRGFSEFDVNTDTSMVSSQFQHKRGSTLIQSIPEMP